MVSRKIRIPHVNPLKVGKKCPCNGLAFYPGGSIANPSYFMLRTQTFLPSNMVTSKLRSYVSRTNNF